MSTVIPNHAHCVICTRAVAFGEKTCSKVCQDKLDTLQKKKKNTLLFIYGAMAVSILLLLLQTRGAF